jgi:hypothetical protein
MLFVASAFVFTIGTPLTLLTEQTNVYFAWTIASPVTAAFLGAAYWSAGVLEYLSARERLWANARIAVPAVVRFTGLTLVVTRMHIDRFHFSAANVITQLVTWAWLIVYAVVPIVMGLLWFLQARTPGAWLIGLGIAAAHEARENDLRRVRPGMISAIVFSALQFAALAGYGAAVAWSRPSSWLYLAFLATLLVVGAQGALAARRLTEAPEPARA